MVAFCISNSTGLLTNVKLLKDYKMKKYFFIIYIIGSCISQNQFLIIDAGGNKVLYRNVYNDKDKITAVKIEINLYQPADSNYHKKLTNTKNPFIPILCHQKINIIIDIINMSDSTIFLLVSEELFRIKVWKYNDKQVATHGGYIRPRIKDFNWRSSLVNLLPGERTSLIFTLWPSEFWLGKYKWDSDKYFFQIDYINEITNVNDVFVINGICTSNILSYKFY